MLTVPKAGTIAGRAAEIRVPQPDMAPLVAEFGNRMLQHGLAWKSEQRQYQVQKTQIDITRDMGAARLEVEQLGGPAQIGPAWDAIVADIHAKHITPDTDPEVAKALDLFIGELNNRHGLALSEKAINLGRSQQEAAWIESLAAITTEAATADPTTFAALQELGEATIDQRVAKGLIDPATGAAEKEAFRKEIYSTRATAAIEADPQAFLAAVEAKEYDPLGGEGITKARLDAQREIDRRAAIAARAAEADQVKVDKAVDDRLSAITSLATKGQIAVDEAYLSDPAVMARPGWGEAMAAVQLRGEMPGIMQMTEAELNAAIAAEIARPKKEPWEAKRVDVLTKRRDEVRSASATDYVDFAVKSDLPVPDLPAFDPANPQDFAAGLTDRIAFDQYARTKGGAKGQAIFSNADKAALKTTLDPKADPDAKLALADAILAGTSGKPGDVLTALEADPTFRRGLSIYATTKDADLFKSILLGQQKIALGNVNLPTEKARNVVFDSVTGGAFSNLPEGTRREIMEAATALYAVDGTGADLQGEEIVPFMDDTEAQALFGTAIARVTGATPDRNGELTIGGLQEVNGATVILPRGVGVEDVEAGMDRLDKVLAGGVWDTSRGAGEWTYAAPDGFDAPNAAVKVEPTDEMRLAPFKAASIYGGVPDFGGQPTTFFRTLTLRRVGESDVYEFVYPKNGRTVPVAQTDGTAYRFRLTDLLEEVAP